MLKAVNYYYTNKKDKHLASKRSNSKDKIGLIDTGLQSVEGAQPFDNVRQQTGKDPLRSKSLKGVEILGT